MCTADRTEKCPLADCHATLVEKRGARQLFVEPFFETESVFGFSNAVCVAKLSGHSGPVTCLAFSPYGLLCAGSTDCTVRVWDPRRFYQHVITLLGHSGPVTALAFSPTGRCFSASEDHTVSVWDRSLDSGRCLATLGGHKGAVTTLAFVPRSALCTGSEDSTVRVWAAESDRPNFVRTLRGHGAAIMVLECAPDGALWSGSRDKTVKAWDVERGVCTVTLAGHSGWVSSLCCSNLAPIVFTGSSDSTVRMWDCQRDVPQCLQEYLLDDGVSTIALAPDGSLCVGSAACPKIEVWDWDPGQPDCVTTLLGHRKPVLDFAFGPGGSLCSASEDRTVRVWSRTPEIWSPKANDTNMDISARGITLRQMLAFYEKLVTGRYGDPDATTADIVKHVVAPLTQDRACSLAEWLGVAQAPRHYVAHTMTSRHRDVLEGLVFFGSGHASRELHVPKLEAFFGLKGAAFLDESYWFCGYCLGPTQLADITALGASPWFEDVVQRICSEGGDVVAPLDSRLEPWVHLGQAPPA